MSILVYPGDDCHHGIEAQIFRSKRVREGEHKPEWPMEGWWWGGGWGPNVLACSNCVATPMATRSAFMALTLQMDVMYSIRQRSSPRSRLLVPLFVPKDLSAPPSIIDCTQVAANDP